MAVRSLQLISIAMLALGCGRFGFDETTAEGFADASAPNPDATTGDAAPNPDAVAQSSCGNPADTLLCDGFESGASNWTATVSGGSAGSVSTPTFRGDGAFRVQTPVPGAEAYLSQSHDPVTSGTLYTRGYFYVPSSVVSVGLVELSNAGNSSGLHTHFAIEDDMASLLVNDAGPTPTVTVPRDAWFCVEIDITIGTSGSAELRIDGQAAGTINNVNTDVPGGYTDAAIGLYYTAPASTAFEMFFDELAVDTRPIGCL